MKILETNIKYPLYFYTDFVFILMVSIPLQLTVTQSEHNYTTRTYYDLIPNVTIIKDKESKSVR